MKNFLVIVCLWASVTASGALAQDAPATQTATTASDPRDANVYDFSEGGSIYKKFAFNVLLDQKNIWTSPFHINHENAKWWILAGVGTAGLLAADHPISQALPFSGTSYNVGNNVSRMGQWYSVFPFAGGMYGIGLLTDDLKMRRIGLESLQALADADIAVNVVKVIARRERPGDGDHGGHFEKGGSSFYSGHSTQAWALASVIALEYGSHKWVPFAAYSYATAVSVARVLGQQHFTSDVFVGGIAGFFIGHYVVHSQYSHDGHAASLRHSWARPSSLSPSVGAGGAFVTVYWTL